MRLNPKEVHVWFADLTHWNTHSDWARSLLSTEEARVADRFRFAHDGGRYCLSHAFTREVLSLYTGVRPGHLTFGRNEYGKPHLLGDGPHFNLSHSGDRAVLGVSTSELGIDIELIRPIPDYEQLADRFFAPAERKAVCAAAHPAERPVAFLTCWTRKEAYIKGVGKGLTIPLDGFDTSTGEPVGKWHISDLMCSGDYVGAVAIADGATEIVCQWWTTA